MESGSASYSNSNSLADTRRRITEHDEPVQNERSKVRNRGVEGEFRLHDGSRVAVIGGGPAGSMFSIFLLRILNQAGTKIQLDIFEPRDFAFSGPAGCNHCGGIISDSLVRLLAEEGIVLPEKVVRRGIDSYDLHMDIGSVKIKTPRVDKSIAAIFRGNGPRDSAPGTLISFDGHLLDLAVSNGSNLIRRLISRVSWSNGRPRVHYPDGEQAEYDLVVVATGVNSTVTRLIEDLGLGYRAPVTVKSFVSEYYLGRETVTRQLGTAMHVFLLDLPRLKFAAIIPKGEYATVVMLGQNIDDELVSEFMNSREVRDCFPDSIVPQNSCHCFPRINLKAAKRPFADRLVVIGDSGVSRLYKDGIGAAYRTAKAAANAVGHHGISKKVFAAHYWPICRTLNIDNAIGRFIFSFSHVLQKNRFARKAVYRMTVVEQLTTGSKRRMSGILWDLFTGSAPYRDILKRTLSPTFLVGVAWNLVAGSLASEMKDRSTDHAQ